ncbi:hypothetical protein IDH44_14685 [Paenibacillus sp. IB182496]|uniref:Methyl-accepting transducer domain-containing protein n=1 Tax=Paenibacillus sabuli TaxID=2772509 RepID=A0A927BVJ6_9BACL|nr:hypothetical protein [Paenibacillus sabuli]MBD2846445.1 hypothetical protein [Paenibacillus sabuli]
MIYPQDPLIYERRSGQAGDEFVEVIESHKVIHARMLLAELPDRGRRVRIDGLNEIEHADDGIGPNEYVVNYLVGLIHVHPSREGAILPCRYYGTGIAYMPASRIWTKRSNGEVVETLQHILDQGEEALEALLRLNDTIAAAEAATASAHEAADDANAAAATANATNEAVQQAEQVRAAKETQRQSAETQRQAEESQRQAAEADRIDTESARQSAELARETAESARASGETQRIGQESERLDAEAQRESQESERQSAETLRAAAEAERELAELLRDAQEAARVTEEAERAQEEAARDAAEGARASAEVQRSHAEGTRVSAESDRAAAEQLRSDAEAARAQAELTREAQEQVRQSDTADALAAAEALRDSWRYLEDYDHETAYAVNNTVAYNGSTYICIQDSTGHAPTDTQYWRLLARKGSDGLGTVTTLTSANGDVLIDAADPAQPDLSVNAGAGANRLVRRDGEGRIPDLLDVYAQLHRNRRYAAMTDVLADLTLRAGDVVQTEGYDAPGDGGAALYAVEEEAREWSIPHTAGLYLNCRETASINYRMFGAPLNGADDDLPAMALAHAYGNANRVLLRQSFGTIYKTSQTGVTVRYDVDLNGAEVRITNDNFWAWYDIANDDSIVYTYVHDVDRSYLKKDTSYFPMTDNSLPRNVVLKLVDGNTWTTRYDAGDVYEQFREELMVHHQEGLCTGPLIHGYEGPDTNLTNFDYTRMNKHRLTFRGCRIRVETTPNITMGFIKCRRHNTHLTGFTIDPLNNSLANVSFKGSIITAYDCYDLEVSKINGSNIAGKPINGTSSSGYVVRFVTCLRVTMRDCNLNGYWGATAATGIKEWTVDNCVMNRIDVHDYFRDLTISNSTLYDWGVNVGYGVGALTIRDTNFVFYEEPDIGGRTIVSLNHSYGLLFAGSIAIDRVTVIKADFDVSVVRCSYVLGENTPRPELRLPDLSVHNLVVQDNAPSSSKLAVWRFTGQTISSTTGTKIRLPDYVDLERIRYVRQDGTGGSVHLLANQTDGLMYSDQVVAAISGHLVDFADDPLMASVQTGGEDHNPLSSGTFVFRYHAVWTDKSRAAVWDKIETAVEGAKADGVNKIALYGSGGQLDPNTTTAPYILTQHANAPGGGGSFYHIRTYFYHSETGNRSQSAQSYSGSNRMFIRYCNAETWSDWTELLSQQGGTLTGPLEVQSGGNALTLKSASGSDHVYMNFYARDAAPQTRSGYIGYSNTGGEHLHIRNQIAGGDVRIDTSSGKVYANGQELWHAGNDGQGSGLDADTVRGSAPSTSASGNTIVQRTSAGNVYVQDVYADDVISDGDIRVKGGDVYVQDNGSGGKVWFQSSDGSANEGILYYSPDTDEMRLRLYNASNSTQSQLTLKSDRVEASRDLYVGSSKVLHAGNTPQTRISSGAFQYYDGGWKNVGGIKHVQRGTASIAYYMTLNVSISTVNKDKAFVNLVNYGGGRTEAEIYAELTSSTNLQIVNQVNAGSGYLVAWEVVEFY